MRGIIRFFSLIRHSFRGIGPQGFLLSALILTLVTLLLVPLPTYALDILLVINFVISLILILMALFVSDWKELYAFPSILLLTTLFRLSLNVSSTRLILLYGDSGHTAAGEIIGSFGKLVVQDDFVVGAIIFAIIAIVNFVVITKGAGRVAEVAARFTLDSLPGRQFAIDADLRAGNITREEAIRLRDALNHESQFYGAMDGSMKFVQGDAIAGFIVVMINAIGGVAIGVSRGLDFSSAVSSFGVLTIGDGMVNIVPALLISVCAGLVVTRVSEKDSQGTSTSADVLQQMGSDPRILTMSAGVLLVLALVPGLPFLPFFVVAVGLLMMSAAKLKKWSENPQLIPRTVTIAGSTKLAVNGLFSAGLASQFALPETGRRPRWDVSEIVVAVDSGSAGRDLVQAGLAEFQLYYNQLREQFLLERGVSLPAVRLDCEATLEPSEYSVAVREQRARNGWWDAKRLFVPLAPSSCRLLGIKDLLETRHPYLSSLACWVAVEELGTEGLVRLGVKVLSPAQFLALEAFSAAVEVIEELVGVDEIKLQLDELRQQHRGLVDEILSSALISAAELADVFRRLIRDRVPVRDLKLILEGIAEYSATHGPFDNRQAFLHGAHQFLRKVLSRTVLQGALGPSGVLRTYTLSPTVEELLREASDEQSSYRAGLVLDPEFQLALRNSSGALFGPVLERGALPVVVLCSADVRLVVDEFLGKQLPSRQWYRTLSYDELDSRIPMESVGVLDCVLSGEA